MGHRISNEGIRPTTSQMKVIQEDPVPQKKIQLFLGMLTYNSKLMSHCLILFTLVPVVTVSGLGTLTTRKLLLQQKR